MFQKIFHTFKIQRTLFHSARGNAMIMLAVFVTVGIIITTATITLVMVNSLSASKFEVGQDTLSIAESGVENALLRLLRDPSYTGETLDVGEGQVDIAVSGSAIKTIVATGTMGTMQRTIEVIADTTTGTLIIQSWREVY